MPEPEHKDITEHDTQFGLAAERKAEEADRMAAAGVDPTEAPEGPGEDPRPRAGNKASEGSPPAAGDDGDEEAVRESFPASDPPASY